jgi:putative hydrolase of the HAD superfamily
MSPVPEGPPRALILDLWQTLVPLPDEVKQEAFGAAARALGENPDSLALLWNASRQNRETRPLSTYLDDLRRSSGRPWTDAMLENLATARLRIHGAMFRQPCPGALRLLSAAKSRALPIAVVSNASSDVRTMFDASPLAEFVDSLILSAEVGVTKPHPAIYLQAAEALNVPAERCVYLGDGNDEELSGAAAVGMTAVLIDRGHGHAWPGPRTDHLEQVLALAGLT